MIRLPIRLCNHHAALFDLVRRGYYAQSTAIAIEGQAIDVASSSAAEEQNSACDILYHSEHYMSKVDGVYIPHLILF